MLKYRIEPLEHYKRLNVTKYYNEKPFHESELYSMMLGRVLAKFFKNSDNQKVGITVETYHKEATEDVIDVKIIKQHIKGGLFYEIRVEPEPTALLVVDGKCPDGFRESRVWFEPVAAYNSLCSWINIVVLPIFVASGIYGMIVSKCDLAMQYFTTTLIAHIVQNPIGFLDELCYICDEPEMLFYEEFRECILQDVSDSVFNDLWVVYT